MDRHRMTWSFGGWAILRVNCLSMGGGRSISGLWVWGWGRGWEALGHRISADTPPRTLGNLLHRKDTTRCMLISFPLGMLVEEESELGMEMVVVSAQVVMAEPA